MSDFRELQIKKNSPLDPILVYVHTEDPFILNYIQSMGEFLQYYYHTVLNNYLNIESMLDGLLYIFQDKNVFTRIHEPISAQRFGKVKERLANPDYQASKYIPKLTDIPHSEKILKCEFANISPEQAFPIMEEYYHSIHPEIELYLEDKHIEIRFPGQQAVYQYVCIIYGEIENSVFESYSPR